MGYHVNKIVKGELGEVSKVMEELQEFEDARDQGSIIMMALELSDALGALDLLREKYTPGITMKDLMTMSTITKRAFITGERK